MPSKTPTLYSNTSFITRYQRGPLSFKFGHKQVFYISANQRSRSHSPTLVCSPYIVSIMSPSVSPSPSIAFTVAMPGPVLPPCIAPHSNSYRCRQQTHGWPMEIDYHFQTTPQQHYCRAGIYGRTSDFWYKNSVNSQGGIVWSVSNRTRFQIIVRVSLAHRQHKPPFYMQALQDKVGTPDRGPAGATRLSSAKHCLYSKVTNTNQSRVHCKLATILQHEHPPQRLDRHTSLQKA